MSIDYNTQMLNYYPEVIKAIREFQVLIETQSLEVAEMHEELTKILTNAYVGTADENRIAKWEHYLGITPLPQGDESLEDWLSDRRETILARLYKVEKLNTKSIQDIVSIFTGGEATSYFKDGIIHILIEPPPSNKQYRFENVEQEIAKKIPAHLQYDIRRNYQLWSTVLEYNKTWSDVRTNYATWRDVLVNDVRKVNKLDTTTLEDFVLG
jgi:hypothetical protein